jgi:flavorubredoxin
MKTNIEEINDQIFRISTYLPRTKLTFNQFLILADDPVLFHCGQNFLFSNIQESIKKVIKPEMIRWVSFSHVESDECGSLLQWMDQKKDLQVFHGKIGSNIWLNDFPGLKPKTIENCSTIDIGGRTLQWLDTPNVPHNWESGMVIDEKTQTLFCSDLFTQSGDAPAITFHSIIEKTIEMEDLIGFSNPTKRTLDLLDMLIQKDPKCLAAMHGSTYIGQGAEQLRDLKSYYLKKIGEYVN